jgi:hypothetical protein
MRIISLDLFLGTPKLQRRIDAERALLRRDLAVVDDNTRQLRAGAVRKATSLPALAAALATGFVVTKMAGRPRRPRPAEDYEEREPSAASAALGASTSLAMQFLMPMLVGWVQARFAPPAPQEPEEEFPAES